MKKHITAHVVLAVTALASQPGWALGFGRVNSDAVLGQPLNFTVPVHVDAGEHFGAECVSADVYFGESRVNPNDVRTRVERGASDDDWLVRISTLAQVGEPVVEIAVNAGCERRFVRRFTAFADPPTMVAATPQGRPATAAGPAALPPRTAPATAASAGVAAARPAARKGPTLALAREDGGRPAAGARHAQAAPAPHAAPRLVLDAGYARLKLDIEDPVIPPAGAASGGAATIALSDFDDPALQQLKRLEQNVAQLRRDGQASRDQAARMRARLEAAESRSDLLPWALGLLALAAAAIVWLVLRLRQQARLAHGAWFAESQLAATTPPAAADTSPAPEFFPPPPLAVPHEPPAARPVDLEVEPFAAGADEGHGAVVADMSATMPLDRAALAGMLGHGEAFAQRELSVEELLDLEQQADFFIALGQEDAAVDLLMSHLRSAGGQSPLPYTKLLEIYKRQGDRSAYERTRARFNRRFNAYAPDWETGPAAGRSLEDYPETIAQIQAMWRSPIDAMALLEAMLFKRDDTGELFDLPAYRDVLLLYSLARDLWQIGGGLGGTQVDVLLPLDDPASMPPLAGLDLPIEGEQGGFAMTGYEPPAGRVEIDLQVPLPDEPVHDDGVHATLDALGLAPAQPTKGRPEPDWDSGKDDDRR